MTHHPSIKVEIDQNVLIQELENEAVILNLNEEHYYGLDDIGLRFWQLLVQHGNSTDVIREMAIEFDAPEDVLHKDLGKFIVELETAGLLEILAK